MQAQVAVAKVGKYATPESGDSLEMIERPAGGLSFVLVDGQSSGKAAKAVANVVARKAIGLLADGVRDGAAARAASDYLYTYRSGKVSATLNILSIDLHSHTLVITRNNPAPVLLLEAGQARELCDPSEAVGTRRDIRPQIIEVPLAVGLVAVVSTDGLVHAGSRTGRQADWLAELRRLNDSGRLDPQHWADHFLDAALGLDDGRPTDDVSVVVAMITPHAGDGARRLCLSVPL
jgi:hypothetical protein